MAKDDAFGTTLSIGAQQVETAVVVGTITGNGNATFTTTFAGMTGSPLATSVAVLNGDTPDTVATKAAAALNLVANFSAKCTAVANGPNVIVTANLAAANDATFNVAYTNGTCTGLTPDATSDNTTAGIAPVSIAQVSNIGGPGLALDTEDVTTHDSTSAFEEVVGTVLRTGEVSLDLVFDPAGDTHDGTATTGLVYALKNKVLRQFDITFPDSGTTDWIFNGYVTGFEPGEPHDGALTATATIKITGVPTLV